jgi:hypothetical protein
MPDHNIALSDKRNILNISKIYSRTFIQKFTPGIALTL